MRWHYRDFHEGWLGEQPVRDGTDRPGGPPLHDLGVSVRPAAAFCDVPDCGWSVVYPDEEGAAGLALAHVIRTHGKGITR